MQVLHPAGPAGRRAARTLAPDSEPASVDDTTAVLAAVDGSAAPDGQSGDGAESDAAAQVLGVVPLEDSHAGLDAATVDGLAFDTEHVVVVAECDVVTDEVVTRWVGVGTQPPRDVADPQTLLFVVPQLNRPGTLLELLAAFSSRGLNLTRFGTRPLRGALGMYGFLLEVEGSPVDEWMRDALADVLASSSHLKWLGTFAAGERAWSPVTGRTPAGTDLRSMDDLRVLVERLGVAP